MTGLPAVAARIGRRRFVRQLAGGAVGAVGVRQAIGRAPVVALKCAHNILARHPTHRHLQDAADVLRRDSDGQIAIEIFPTSQLGGETDLLGQLRAGAIDLLPLSGLTLQTLVPIAGINGLAFAFDDYAAVWSAMDGAVGELVRADIAAAGLHAFDRMFDNGFRNITTRRRTIQFAADLAGLKIRVPVSPLWTSMFKALGAVPTSINFAELYVSLQTRLVDAQENPLIVIDLARLSEVQGHCSLTGHMWDGHWLLANGERWQRLPGEVRSLLTTRLTEAIRRQRTEILQLNASLVPQLQAAGLLFNVPGPKTFRDALGRAGFYDEWRRRFGATAMAALERAGGRTG